MKSTTPNIIFYGAGLHAHHQLALWERRGIIPACFADKDTKKHYTSFRGYEVLPLAEAINRYPDYVIYPTQTQSDLLKITKYLRNLDIPDERIKYFEPLEKRLGCASLEGVVTIISPEFCSCCKGIPSIKFGKIKEGIDKYNAIVNDLVSEFRSGTIPAVCDGCECIEDNLWSVEPKLKTLSLNTGFKDDICPCKCSYCNAKPNFEIIDTEDALDLPDIIQQLGTIYGDYELNLSFGDGDFTSRRDCDEILKYIISKKWAVTIPSTGLVYRESVCDLSRAGLLKNVIISPDSGTPETYKKIKSINGFHKVVENVEKYAAADVQVELQYIMLDGINDNKKDIDNFLELVSRIGADCIFSHNMLDKEKRMSAQALDMSVYFVKKCKELNPQISYRFFHPYDAEIIKTALAENCR